MKNIPYVSTLLGQWFWKGYLVAIKNLEVIFFGGISANILDLSLTVSSSVASRFNEV